VDDKYDFHTGKQAVISTTQTVKKFGYSIDVTVNVSVPDDVILDMQETLGSKDFDRKVSWSVKLGH